MATREEIIEVFREVLFEMAEAESFEQGFEKGRADGTATSLIKILELRFGPLKTDYRDRILKSDLASAEAWITRAVQASDLHAVFE